MRNFFTIWRRELSACFLSSVAYVTMVVFLTMSGWVFLQLVEGHVGSSERLSVLLFKVIIFFWMPILVTLITMRLFAEEKRSGTIETLMTSPVTEAEVVLGKYAGAIAFLLVVAVPAVSAIFILSLMSPGIGAVDLGAVMGGCLVLVLIAGFCTSIGLLLSLLTRNQIVAAVCCFCGALVPLLTGHLVSILPLGSESILEYVSADVHILDFARGSVDTRPIVLYVSGTAFMLFAAVRVLESRRWR